ncbi:MAG: TatD family hydrolase [Alphaproteobacteria bacterium]|nr:TatD family hydrolase [Alphaproteobacteria bacterium]
MTSVIFVDSHCHLDLSGFEEFLKPRLAGKTLEYYNVDLLVDRAFQADVKYMLNIGTHLSDVDKLTEISDKFSNVFRSIGIHPEYAKEHCEKFSFDEMREIFQRCCGLDKTVAIGEIGLDYHVSNDVEQQKKIFSFQLELAEEFNLPVSIHSRDAWADTMEILEAHPKVTGVIHCFSGEKEFAEKVLNTSFYFGIGGTLTFKKNTIFQETVRDILSLDRILIETDSPFLAPVPFRGKLNEPSFVVHVAEKIAELKNISIDQIANQTSRNFFELFNKAKF